MAVVRPRDMYGKPPAEEAAPVSRRSLLRLRRSRTGDVDYDSVTDRVRAGWDLEGHERLLRELEPAAEVVADLAGIGPGHSVLDVAAGDGNLALAAARRGADVEACDLAPRMVERGQARSAEAGRTVAWQVADAQALPYPDASFDAVVSTFGACLAPRAAGTARELARVTRPGGLAVMTAWVPRGLPGRLDELVEPLAPLPAGVPRPDGWGVAAVASRRLEPLFERVEVRTRTLTLSFSTPDELFDTLTRPYLLDGPQRAELRPSFDRLLASCNSLPPAVRIDARYLIALALRPT